MTKRQIGRNKKQRDADGDLVFPGGPLGCQVNKKDDVARVANVTAVPHETPSGTIYTFFCKYSHQHQTRQETAACSAAKDGAK